MSQSFQFLTERGSLPTLPRGSSTTFAVNLRDGEDNFLPIHQAESVSGVVPSIIFNTPTPAAAATITFTNISDADIPAGALYIVSNLHTIQHDPLATFYSRAANPVVAADADSCKGSAIASTAGPVVVAPAASIPLNNIVTFGSIGLNMTLAAGNLLLPNATVLSRSWKLEGQLLVQTVGIEPVVTVELQQNPIAGTVLQTLSSPPLAAGDFCVLPFSTVITLNAAPTVQQRTIGLVLSVAAGNINCSGITLIASSL